MVALVATAALALDLAGTRAQSCATVNVGPISKSGAYDRAGQLAVGDCGHSFSNGFRLADHYAFQLLKEANVQLWMQQTGSRSGDPYISLLNPNAHRNSRHIESNDNSGPGVDAVINRRLAAGTYRVEATSASHGQKFAYLFRISVAYIDGDPDVPPDGDGDDTGDSTGGDDTSNMVDDSSGTAVSGRIIARIENWSSRNENVDCDWRIQFGFLPEWTMEAHSPNWADAVTTHRDFLPTERFLPCEVVASRRNIGRDDWLVSSEIEAPPRGILGSGSDDGFAGEDEDEGAVLGRVIARVLSRSSLRIEFGFLPEWAYENAGNNAQTAADHAVLPANRFITQALINTWRGRWLRSAPPSTIPSEPCRGEGFTGVPSQIQTQAGRPLASELTVGWIECPISDELNAFRVTGLPAGLSLNHRFASANRRRLVLSGTPSAALTPRSYPVTITARPQSGGSLLRATTTIQVAEPLPKPETEWDGYRTEQATVRGDVALTPPVVIRGPAQPVWSYRSATSDICDVQATSGSLTLKAEGECEVIATLAADLPRWASTEETAIVRVGGVVLPCITWAGYDPASMATGGSSPTLLRPRAADCRTNRALSLTYTFALDNPSSDVCQVDASTGRITALREGTCTIVTTSAPSGSYGSATSRRSVTISQVPPPCLGRVRYAAGSVRVGASLDSPEPSPLPSCLTSQMTYETTTSAICNVNSRTGRLSGSAEGTCRITITSPKTSSLRESSATREVTVDRKPPPDPCSLSYAGNVDVGASARANFFCPSGGTPAFRTDDTTICSFINPTSGDVTGHAQGTCSIVVNVAETDTTAATTVRAQLTVQISRPTCTTPDNREFSGSQSSVQIDLDRYCDNTDSYRASSSNNNVATHSLSGSQLTLRPGGSEGSSTIQVTAINRGGSTTTSFTVSRRTARPVISINCSPPSPMVNQSVTCTYRLDSGDRPTSFDWRGGASSGSSMRYTTSFSTPGSKTISLTVSNAGGSDSGSTSVTVSEIVQPPVINNITCMPSSPTVNQSVTCTANLSGGAPTTYSWSGGASSGSDSSYATSFNTSGNQIVSLEVINSGGSDTSSISISVAAETPMNRAPKCDSVPNQVVQEIGSIYIDLRSYCVDPDEDQLRFTYAIVDNYQSRKFSVTTSVYGQPTHGLSRISGRDRGVGNGMLNITATDPDGLYAQTSISVKVGNEPPTWICDPLPRVYILRQGNSSETLDLTSCFHDPEGGSLTYRVYDGRSLSNVRYTISGSRITLTAPYAYAESGLARITATDDGYLGDRQFANVASTNISLPVTVLPWAAEYATCDDKPASVSRESEIYYFNTTSWTKHYLDLSVTEFIEIVGSTRFHRVTDQMSSSQCDDWNTGDTYDASKVRELVRDSN